METFSSFARTGFKQAAGMCVPLSSDKKPVKSDQGRLIAIVERVRFDRNVLACFEIRGWYQEHGLCIPNCIPLPGLHFKDGCYPAPYLELAKTRRRCPNE